MVHVIDTRDLRIAGQGDLVKTHGTHLLKGRLQRGQPFQRGAGFDELVLRQDGLPQKVGHGDDGVVEIASALGSSSALLRCHGKNVHIGAAETFNRRNQVRTNALRHKANARVGVRVLRPRAAIRSNWHPAHAFHATSDDQVFPTRGHFLRRHVDGFQTRGAKAVDLHPRGAEVPARFQRCNFGQDRALFTNRRDDAHHHVVHRSRIKAVALLQIREQASQQSHWLDLIQTAVLLAFTAWCADGVVNKCFGGHGHSPVVRFSCFVQRLARA